MRSPPRRHPDPIPTDTFWGRLPAIGCGHFSDLEDQDTTLSKFLPELRLLARYRGEKWVRAFDEMVVPWAREALGHVPRHLVYNADLSSLQIISVCDQGSGWAEGASKQQRGMIHQIGDHNSKSHLPNPQHPD